MIDGGSLDNIVLQALVGGLKLRVRKHHRPCFVRWLITCDEVQVQHKCQVTFAISKDNKDSLVQRDANEYWEKFSWKIVDL